MKKLAKKVVVAVSLASMMAMSLVGCTKKTECGNCKETKKCTKYEFSMAGEEGEDWFCEDCVDECKAMVEMFGGTFKKK